MDDSRRDDANTTSRGFTIIRLPDPQFDDDWAHIFVPDETKQRLLRYADRLFQARSAWIVDHPARTPGHAAPLRSTGHRQIEPGPRPGEYVGQPAPGTGRLDRPQRPYVTER